MAPEEISRLEMLVYSAKVLSFCIITSISLKKIERHHQYGSLSPFRKRGVPKSRSSFLRRRVSDRVPSAVAT